MLYISHTEWVPVFWSMRHSRRLWYQSSVQDYMYEQCNIWYFLFMAFTIKKIIRILLSTRHSHQMLFTWTTEMSTWTIYTRRTHGQLTRGIHMNSFLSLTPCQDLSTLWSCPSKNKKNNRITDNSMKTHRSNQHFQQNKYII